MTKYSFYNKGGKVQKQQDDSKPQESDADVVRRLKQDAAQRESPYRRRSLEIHGWVCARCGREFDSANLHLLTVHHIDGNHNNNPPDGSNWENLCVYCHEAEHSQELIGNAHQSAGTMTDERVTVHESGGSMGTLADLLAAVPEKPADKKRPPSKKSKKKKKKK